MRAIAIVVLCGCNRILGLGDVSDRHVDARLFDGPPPTCPVAPGVPTFGEALHQVERIDICSDYAIATDGSAMAICRPTTGQYTIYTARPGAALAPATVNLPNITSVVSARLAGDGDFALVPISEFGGFSVHAIARDPSTDTWSPVGVLPVSLGQTLVATPSAGPQRHVVYFDIDPQDSQLSLYELVGDAGTWTQQDRYTVSTINLGSALYDSVALTPDGLALVGITYIDNIYGVFYTSRASPTDRFEPARLITSLPSNVAHPFLTNNCGELYFEAIERILYLQQ